MTLHPKVIFSYAKLNVCASNSFGGVKAYVHTYVQAELHFVYLIPENIYIYHFCVPSPTAQL